jgi:hypothetical protein
MELGLDMHEHGIARASISLHAGCSRSGSKRGRVHLLASTARRGLRISMTRKDVRLTVAGR